MLVKYLIEQEHDLIENSQFYLESQWFLLSVIIQYFSWRGEKQGIFFPKGFLLKIIYSRHYVSGLSTLCMYVPLWIINYLSLELEIPDIIKSRICVFYR